eukprot:scaffold57544_cov51-Phaeocystis_antarctica.AAC.1
MVGGEGAPRVTQAGGRSEVLSVSVQRSQVVGGRAARESLARSVDGQAVSDGVERRQEERAWAG